MRLKKIGLISILGGLWTGLFFPLPLQAKPKLIQQNQQNIVAQRFPNWSRVRIDEFFSILFPGDWNYTENSVDSFFDRTFYTAMYENIDAEIPDLEGVNICDLMNCKTLLAVAVKELAQEGGFSLQELNPIAVSLQGYPIDGVDFRATHNSESLEMVGRMLIVGDKMYFLSAVTDNPYFDNNVEIFLESFSQ